MDPLHLLAASLGASFVAAWQWLAARRRRRRRVSAWRQAADAVVQAVGLSGALVRDDSLEGFAPGPFRRLHLRLSRSGEEGRGERLCVRIPTSDGDHELWLEARRWDGAESRGRVEQDIGDREFSDTCGAYGPPELAFAVLDADTRRRMAALLDGSLETEGGRSLRVSASFRRGVLEIELLERATAELLRELAGRALVLARRLAVPPDLPQRIAENLRREPLPAVREKALQLLVRGFPEHPATRPSLLAALTDESPPVRLSAAIALGEDGREALREIASSSTVDDSCCARAIEALGAEMPDQAIAAALRHSVEVGHQQTAAACLGELARSGRAVDEAATLEALRSSFPSVAVAAARVLGRAGTVAAVPALLDVAEHGQGDLCDAARQAVGEIQSRVPGAGPGQLSLSAAQDGALSLTDDVRGALSVAEPGEP